MKRGFTLIELMVSVAMVLVLVLGINAVFRIASDTVHVGQALAAANRENRAVQSVLYDDLRTAVIIDGPLLLVRGERVAAFRNRADEQDDRDGDPLTVDLDANNREGDVGVRGEVTPPLVYNGRNHRIDRVCFFGSNLYRRQTGTEGPSGTAFIDDGTSFEAFHWYGHLDQPDFGRPLAAPGRFEHRSPGELPNRRNANNYYATDWILGRSVTLVKEQPAPPGAASPPNYFDYQPGTATDPNLSPLYADSRAKGKDARGVEDRLCWSRYDLAQTSVGAFRQTLAYYNSVRGLEIDDARPAWYELLGGEWGPAGNARFQGYAYPDRPLTPYGVARTVPVWVRGCTQFVVEYAGDYLKQNQDGSIADTYLGGGTDGQIDFLPVMEQAHPSEPVRTVRRVRWYGMPRNTDARDDVAGPVIAGAPAASAAHDNLYDVVPLRDLLLASGKVSATPADFFERFENLGPAPNYAALGAVVADPHDLRYYAAWGPVDLARGSPTRPKMLRVTMTVDDPNARMGEGQTFEYVLDLP